MQAPDLKADLELLVRAALASGDIAQRHFKSDVQIWDKADNAGPVTAADLEIDAMLKDQLLSARPSYGWLSEETDDDKNRLDCDCVFIVDPIDGTRAFIEGRAHWGHSLAIAHKGKVQTAAVYLPVPDLLFTATQDGGAFLGDTRIDVSDRQDAHGACVLAAKANFQDVYWPGGFPGVKRSFRSSLAYRLCLVGDGAFDGMLTLRPTWEWDVAAGTLIVEQAGGTVTTQAGNPVSFNTPNALLDGIVAANPMIHTQLIKGLTPA
ncbi:MAG: 3'(2'),5'-bisphosphate nucleotidase CysQ [Pseudomonadota bacterium]